MRAFSTLILFATLLSAIVASSIFIVDASPKPVVGMSAVDFNQYSGHGNLTLYDVDYWWIPNVVEGDTVLLSVIPDRFGSYNTWLCYSNLTDFQQDSGARTHIHDFIAPISDDYLLKIYAWADPLNYDINCTRIIEQQSTYEIQSSLSEGEVYNHWISDVVEGDTVLLSVIPDRFGSYNTWLCYSNLTDFQQDSGARTHIHDFIAPISDDYLLKIEAWADPLNVTIKCSAIWNTEVQMLIEPNPAFVGETVTVIGNLTTTEGRPVSGRTVTLKLNGVPRGVLTTDPAGSFHVSREVPFAGTFNVTASYAGSTQYRPSSASTTLVVHKSQTWIYAAFTPNPVGSGDSCKLRGITVDQFSTPVKHATLTLEYSVDYGTTWEPAGTLMTDAYGIFSYGPFSAPTPGIYLLNITYAGSADHQPSSNVEPLIVN